MLEMFVTVDERTETVEQGIKFTLHGKKADGSRQYGTYFIVDASQNPASARLKVGETLRVTFESVPEPVSEVERTIEEAEAHGLHPAMLV